jgi:glycosyltransferase involved in cell wall biosynthesis
VSRVNRDRGVELGLWKPDQVSVIRAGVDLDRFRSPGDGRETRRQLGVPDGVSVVTQIGNFKPQKAPLDFIEAAARIVERFPEVCFVMVGDGPLRGEAQTRAAELGIADRVIFCGWWDDVPGLLAATSVSVLSSHHEGLPCSVVESLAAGVPVVATAVDGTPEVIRPGVNGELVAPGDPGGLAAAVLAILDDAERRQSMAAAAADGLDDFGRDHMVRQLEELYRWMVGSNPC